MGPLLALSKSGMSVIGLLLVNHSHFNWLIPSAIGTSKSICAICDKMLMMVFRVRSECQSVSGLPSKIAKTTSRMTNMRVADSQLRTSRPHEFVKARSNSDALL